MKRNINKVTPQRRNLNRREVLSFISATAAASLVGGTSEQIALSNANEFTNTERQKPSCEDRRKTRPITIDAARTAVMVVDMQNDFGTEAACSTMLDLIFP